MTTPKEARQIGDKITVNVRSVEGVKEVTTRYIKDAVIVSIQVEMLDNEDDFQGMCGEVEGAALKFAPVDDCSHDWDAPDTFEITMTTKD